MKTIAPEAPTSHSIARCNAATRGAGVTDEEKPSAVAAYAIRYSRTHTTLQPSLPATNAKRLRKGANGSRECAPDDNLRDEAIQLLYAKMDCFASLAMTFPVLNKRSRSWSS